MGQPVVLVTRVLAEIANRGYGLRMRRSSEYHIDKRARALEMTPLGLMTKNSLTFTKLHQSLTNLVK